MASSRTSILVNGLLALVLLLVLPLEQLLRQPLESSGLRVIERIQSGFSHSTWNSFFYVLANWSDWIILVVAPVVMQFGDPRKGVKVVMVLTLGMYLLSIVNMIYGEPRPFWLSSHVKGYKCSKGYSNPNYTLGMLTCAYFYCTFQYYKHLQLSIQRALLAFGCFLVLVVSIAQMYEGVTFLHQIVITLCYCFLIVTLTMIFDKYLSHIAYVSAFRYKDNRVHSIYWYIATLALLLAAITVFDLITMQRFINLRWVENANTECKLQADLGYDESFFPSAWVFYNMGILNGSMFVGKYIPGKWWDVSVYLRCIRTLILIGLTIGLHYLFRTSHTGAVPATDTTTKYVFFHALLYGVTAYSVALFPLLGQKLKLNNTSEEASTPILVPLEDF